MPSIDCWKVLPENHLFLSVIDGEGIARKCPEVLEHFVVVRKLLMSSSLTSTRTRVPVSSKRKKIFVLADWVKLVGVVNFLTLRSHTILAWFTLWKLFTFSWLRFSLTHVPAKVLDSSKYVRLACGHRGQLTEHTVRIGIKTLKMRGQIKLLNCIG